MATSGSKSITVTSWDTLQFNWSEKSQSTANNTTTIEWTLKLISGSSGKIISSVSKNWSVTVNGTKYSGTNSVAIGNNETKTLASGTTTIEHDSDGSKVFSYSFSQQFDITFSGSWIGTRTGSGTGTLDTIARKSTLSVANGTLGTAQTLTITKGDSSFAHKIIYSCGSVSSYAMGGISTTNTANSVSWTPPLTLAAQNTTDKTVSIKFILYTYTSSGDLVGSNTYTKTFTIPNKLSCSVSVSDATGKSSTYGYIKGVSKFKVEVTPDTSNSYSPVSAYSVTANDATYTKASFTTDVLKKSGNLTISAKVTDKRGHSYTKTQTVKVEDYTAPTVSKLSVNRCNSDGTANSEGAYIKVTYSGAITSLNSKNTAKFQLKYKKTTETSYISVDLSTAYTVTNETKVFAADTASSYDVQIVATDAFSSTTRSTSASSGFTIMHFNADGNGMGLGKVCEFAGLDVGFDARFQKNINIGNKTGYLDGKQGVHLNKEGYIHLQRTGAVPYIAFMHDASTAVQAVMRWNYNNKLMEYLDAAGYSFDKNTFVGDTKAWDDGLAGTKLSPSGGIVIQRVSGSSPYLDFRLYGTANSEATAGNFDGRIILDKTDKYMGFRGASRYDFDKSIYCDAGLRLGNGDTTGKTQININTYWSDKTLHNIITRGGGDDSLVTNFGWAGDATYKTVTQLRGQTCKYGGSTLSALSDKRLKKDFTGLDGWEAFFYALEPCAYKYKTGSSGRYHIGFISQQVEKALTDSGLTTQDFGGFVISKFTADADAPKETEIYKDAGINPGDDEYGLAYTEFIGLNTYMIKKLSKENAELKEKVNDLEERLLKLEKLMNVQGGENR